MAPAITDGGGGGRRPAAAILVPLGAALAAACFFLPYVRVIRVFGAAFTLTGARIGGGLWLVPAAAAAVLVAHFGLRRRTGLRRLLVLCAAALGLLLLSAVVFRLHHRAGFLFVRLSAAQLGIRPAAGWLGSVVGFVLVVAGALL